MESGVRTKYIASGKKNRGNCSSQRKFSSRAPHCLYPGNRMHLPCSPLSIAVKYDLTFSLFNRSNEFHYENTLFSDPRSSREPSQVAF